jgi:A/G-specific adenine glycosylase
VTGAARALLSWYARAGRAGLPWRTIRDPYYTLVSEFMLQQTQVDRVVPKFEAFVAAYPGVRELALAPIADVLRAWQGLGYNSRAVRLKRAAEEVVARFDGRIPSNERDLRTLPGVGPYTVSAIRAFGFNLDDVPLDTNVRRIVHRVFFGLEHPPAANRAQLDARAREIAPAGMAHDWNSALMDLGATICTARAPRCAACPLRGECVAAPIEAIELAARRAAHAPQKSPQAAIRFERSTRFARGRIVDRLRALPPGEAISLLDLHRDLAGALPERSVDEIGNIVSALQRDGLVAVRGERLALAE